ncbi:MAG: glycosyltransferase [Deltaproteobacteria bacterium]|nr:glycosyltransferase [Deltaproteobacteria bacterium]
MKILVITTEYPPEFGGISELSATFSRALKQAGASVRVLTSVPLTSPAEDEYGLSVTRTSRVLGKKFIKILPLYGQALKICLVHRPQLILAMSWTQPGLAAWLIKQTLGIEYAVVANGWEINRYRSRRMVHRLMLHILESARRIIAISSYTRGKILDLGLDPGRVALVNPAVDADAWPLTTGTDAIAEKFEIAGKRVILTTARLVERKGHARVIRVLSRISQKYPDLVYVLTGRGDFEPSLKSLVAELGLQDRVRMLGFVSSRELRALYQLAQVYISPSLEVAADVEGFGMSFIEAGLYATPVIAGRTGGVLDAVAHGRSGFLVDPLDEVEITDRLVQLLDDHGLRTRMGLLGRDRAKKEFGLDIQGQRLSSALASGSDTGKRKLKVLHVITRLDKGGAPKNTLLTVSGLNKERYEVVLVSGPSYDPEEDLDARTRQAGVKFLVCEHLARPIRPLADLKALWTMYRFMRQNRFDLVHTHTSKAGVIGRAAALLAGVPVIIHASHGHIYTGFYGPLFLRILLLIDRFQSRWTDRIITLTAKGLEEQVRMRIAPRSRFRVIPSGIDLARFMHTTVSVEGKRAELGLPPIGPVLGMVAELDPRKGHAHLIEAMPAVLEAHPDARLLIVGQGPLEHELRAMINALGLRDAIILTGHREDVPEILHLLDVFVLSSVNEGMGRVIVEAMACARPVVASDLMGIPELVEHGLTGYLFRPRDSHDLAGKIIDLLDNPEKAEKMGQRGRDKVYPRYDETVMVRAYEDLYREVLAE